MKNNSDLKSLIINLANRVECLLQWQRKQLWNEKLGKSAEVMEPVMSAVTITGRPEELKKPEAKQINVTNAPISFILIKLSDGMSLRKYNTNPDEVSSLLSKLIV